MKKFKAVLGVALVCALAVTCFAFTACGDNTFNIDTTKQATNDELKSFNDNVASANKDVDAETGLPVAFAGKSFKVVLKTGFGLDASGVKMDYNIDMDGIVNAAEKPTAKLKGDMSVSFAAGGTTTKENGNMEVTVVDDTMYVYSKNSTTTTKEKYSLSSILDKFDGLANNETLVYADAAATTDEKSQTVEEFLDELKDTFAQLGVTVDPKLYIDGGVMKVRLTDDSYVGVAYDNDWHLQAIDIMLKDFDLTLGDKTTGTTKMALDLELTMRVASAQTVTAPSDAGDYTKSIFGGFLA